jgi:hypothetical protein
VLVCPTDSTAPFVCADFDEPAGTLYRSGIATPLPAATNGATVELRAPAVSPSNALWMTMNNASYVITANGVPATKLHATFELQLGQIATNPFEIVELRITDAGGNECDVSAQLDNNEVHMFVTCTNSGGRLSMNVFPGLPMGWIPCTLDLDLVTATASMSLGNLTPVTVDFHDKQPPTTGMAQMRAGVLVNESNTTLAIDDLVVTAL